MQKQHFPVFLLIITLVFSSVSPAFAQEETTTTEEPAQQETQEQEPAQEQNLQEETTQPSQEESTSLEQDGFQQLSGESEQPYKDQNQNIQTELPEPDQTTGALTYEYPFTLPPGRNDLQPDLALVYNSQQTKDVNAFGYGWSTN